MIDVSKKKKVQLDTALAYGDNDYQRYLQTDNLFACQKPAEALCNTDELSFQIVHQVEELWMKLIGYTLCDIESALSARQSSLVHIRFNRVHRLQRLMREQLELLHTMSPRAYAEIRDGLGQGNSQDSPTYRHLIKQPQLLWDAYVTRYLDLPNITLKDVYLRSDQYSAAYGIAECMVEFDLLFARFRHAHLQIVDRMLGLMSVSLKGMPVNALAQSVNDQFFPLLWAVRGELNTPVPGGHRAAGKVNDEND